MSVDGNKSWSFETINGKKYFETLLSLFEVLDGPEHAELCVESDIPGLVLYAYRNTENGEIIVPGLELLHGSLPVITDAIARAMAGQKWPTLYKNFNTTLKHELASKRALFDLESGAQKEKVVANLEKFISSDLSGPESNDDEDDDDSWDALRQKIDGTKVTINSKTSELSDRNLNEDSDSESDEEEEENEKPKDLGESASNQGGHKINGGFPGVSVNIDAVNSTSSFFGGGGDKREFAKTNSMIQSLKEEMEHAQKHRDGREDEDADNDIDDKLLKKALPSMTHEYNGQVYPVLMPTNVVVNQNGKIVARNDNALLGRTAKEARIEQQKKEAKAQDPNFDPFATRKTFDQVEKANNAKKPKTVADELQGFGLPAEFMQDLSKQPIAKQTGRATGAEDQSEASDAQYPTSIDDILHLAKPFKKTASAEKEDKQTNNQVDIAATNPVKETVVPAPVMQETLLAKLAQNNTIVNQSDILRLYRAQTAQLEAMVELNRAIEAIILSK